MKTRLDEYDFLKGILMICVIWGHLCMYTSGKDYDGNYLTHIMRLFQMPLFVLISGLFYKMPNTATEVKTKFIKLFKHIGLPLLVWVLLTSLSTVMIYNNYNLYFIFNSIRGSLSTFWYFNCLILCIVFTDLIYLWKQSVTALWGGWQY